MANESNLHPVRSTDEARELGRRGGIASGVARREKCKMRQILTEALLLPHAECENNKHAMATMLINKALTGDIRAFEMIMKFTGEMPTQHEQTSTDEEIANSPFDILNV